MAGLYAKDGSYNIVLDKVGKGLYSPEGYYRCTTSTEPPGVYEKDGSYRVVFGSPGTGVMDSSGSYRISTEAGSGVYAKDGAFRVTITNPATPVKLYPTSIMGIGGESSVQNLGDGTYHVTSFTGGSGIRFNFALDQLKINTSYTASFSLSALAGDAVHADVCDDTPLGPFTAGAKTFTFTRGSYTSIYRFIDIYAGVDDDVNTSGSFTINTLTLTET